MSEEKQTITKAELLKLPLPKLREVALKIEGLQGVHGMSKEELIKIIANTYKIDLTDRPELQVDKRAVKAKVKELKAALAQARSGKDKRKTEALKRRVRRLKHKIRWR